MSKTIKKNEIIKNSNYIDQITKNLMRSYISHIINAMYKMTHSMPTLNLLASNKALTYVELSIECYN